MTTSNICTGQLSVLHPDLISTIPCGFREVPPEFENFRHRCMVIWKFRDGLEICFGQLNQRFNFCFGGEKGLCDHLVT